VEAGVDLDFCHVYRQIAGVDSIIQAAGRCNREGQEKAEDSIVFVFDVTDSKIAPSQRLPVDIAKAILQETDDISDLDSITEYFKRLYRFREQSLDKKNIMGKFQEHKYNFETAAKKFRLIEEDTRTILVPVEQEAEELLAELKHQGFSKERMRKASQYCIQVYDNLFKILWDAGMIQEISSDATEFYELVKLDQYTEDMGLDLSVDSGMDLYL
jgi:CRISPR-associated endonuclease/helicase Cas3